MLKHYLLFLQISSLAFENKILIMKLGQTYKDPSQRTNNFNRDSCSSVGETKEGVHGTPNTGHKVGILDLRLFF